MTRIVISPLEYVQRLWQITNGRLDEYHKQVENHGRKLGKYLDAKERRSGMRERNRRLLDEKIHYHFQKKEYFQIKIDLIQSRLQTLRETYTYENQNPESQAEVKQEPNDDMEDNEDMEENRVQIEAEVKQEPNDDIVENEDMEENRVRLEAEVKQEIKEEPITLPNVIKSEPSA